MSSGLPINTYNQAAEYRKRYLATLALEVQNDAYNLQANQVYRQTGQPSRPPDSRSTTEKLADLEGMKVSLRSGLMSITDGTQANETLERLTPDEVVFTSQQLPAIVSELKPRFARGVPADALVQYIRALRDKFLATNGVSFTAQEATAQQILNAIQAGRNQMGAPPGPIPGGAGVPPGTGAAPPQEEFQEDPEVEAQRQRDAQRQAQIRRRAEDWLDKGREPISSLSREVQDMVNAIRAEKGGAPPAGQALQIGAFRNDQDYQKLARMFGPDSIEEWNAYPRPGGFAPDYPDSQEIQKEFLKMWARAQVPEVQAEFGKGWQSKKSLSALKTALTPGVILKLSYDPEEDYNNPMDDLDVVELQEAYPSMDLQRKDITIRPRPMPPSIQPTTESSIFDRARKNRKKTPGSDQAYSTTPGGVGERFSSGGPSQQAMLVYKLKQGLGSSSDVRSFLQDYYLLSSLALKDGTKVLPEEIQYDKGKPNANLFSIDETNLIRLIQNTISGLGVKKVPVRRAGEPASRYPTGRDILGYGLRVPKPSKKAIQVDITKGVVYNPESTFVPFGKYIVNPNKLSSGVFEIKTMRGGLVAKYPSRRLSPSLSKIMNRIVGGRMPDDYDFEELDVEDQNFLYNLSKDAKIIDRINMPAPKRSKESEESNRFEILKGQIMAGNDNKELVKEFKQMLVRFSNDGRIKKAEAREILLDLAALGY